MSFIDCIMGNEALSLVKRQRLVKEYNDILYYNKKQFGDLDGPQQAARNYIALKEENLTQLANNRIRHALADEGVMTALGKESIDYGNSKKGWGSLLRFDSNVAGALVGKLEKLATKIGAANEMALRSLSKEVEKYRSKNAGVTQDVAGFRNVVSEILGKSTGDADAANFAKPIQKLFSALRDDYEAAGGVIGKLHHYFPQRDIPDVVKKTDIETWKAAKRRLVDRQAMIDPRTGMPLTDAEFEKAMDEIYREITNHGLDDVAEATELTAGLSRGDISSRRSAHRFFKYKNADAFFENNRLFGGGDAALFDNMVDYIQAITRDTVIMREFGPKSGVVMQHVIALAKTNGASPIALRTLNGMWDTVSGANSYGGAAGVITKAIEGTQNALRAIMLGGAPVSAVSDSFWGVMAAKYNGLDAVKVTRRYFSYLNPLDDSDRQIAKNASFVASAVNGNNLAAARHADLTQGGGIARWGADFINRSSGLGIMTDSVRSAVVLEAQGMMVNAKNMGKAFKGLPPEMRDAFARWGMDETDYKAIISADPWVADATGAAFIRPEDVMKVSRDTAEKYGAWLYDMSQVASNEPRLLTRAITSGAVLGSAKRGDPARLVGSTAFMFKSFAITVMLNHILPAMQRGAEQGKWGRAAAIMTAAPMLGAMTVQAKQYLYGKTAKDMDSIDFWKTAFLQGGAFGYFGDYIFADVNRYDYSFGEQILGPAPQLVTDTAKLFFGNLEKALEDGEEANFMKNASKYFQRYTPKLWYTRLLQERLIYDELNRMTDPLYDTKMRRLENKMREDTGTEFWSPP